MSGKKKRGGEEGTGEVKKHETKPMRERKDARDLPKPDPAPPSTPAASSAKSRPSPSRACVGAEDGAMDAEGACAVECQHRAPAPSLRSLTLLFAMRSSRLMPRAAAGSAMVFKR